MTGSAACRAWCFEVSTWAWHDELCGGTCSDGLRGLGDVVKLLLDAEAV